MKTENITPGLNFRSIALFVVLLGLPNLLGMVNVSAYGFKLHFFQLAVFMAALAFGPVGGLLSGIVGSGYSALMMHNPYLLVGNAILGFMFGLFAGRLGAVRAALLAFAVELPWLVATDYFFMHMPLTVILGLVAALAVSNVVWALAAKAAVRPIRSAIQ